MSVRTVACYLDYTCVQTGWGPTLQIVQNRLLQVCSLLLFLFSHGLGLREDTAAQHFSMVALGMALFPRSNDIGADTPRGLCSYFFPFLQLFIKAVVVKQADWYLILNQDRRLLESHEMIVQIVHPLLYFSTTRLLEPNFFAFENLPWLLSPKL